MRIGEWILLGFCAFIFGAMMATCAEPKIHLISGNIAADFEGEADDRSNTWGTAGAVYNEIKFNVPPTKRVRILQIQQTVRTLDLQRMMVRVC